MLSLRELKRAALVLERKLAGSTLQKVVQPDDFRLALVFRSRETETVILLSCQPEFARLEEPPNPPKASQAPPSFTQCVQAHLSHASFGGMEVGAADRRASISLLTREGVFKLILSILGSRSNVYLVNAEGRLIHALRPLEETRQELVFGEPWLNPEGVLRSEGADRWEMLADEQYLAAIGHYYGGLERAGKAESLSRKIEGTLRKEEAFLCRKAVNLQGDLGEARRAEEYRRKGELLKSVLHSVRQGDSSICATDYETGESAAIPLDTTLSPAENLEAYFGRYQKELRGVAAIEQQLESVRRSQTALQEIRSELDSILAHVEPDLDSLERLSAEPRVRRLLGRYHPRSRAESAIRPHGARKPAPGRLLPKRYRAPDGLEIWVGRNDESNDYLTTRLARGNDLFFHLEGYPGSHVILRTEGRADPPPASMLAACELAVHFSKLKNASRADVHVACVKDVRKPRGVKRGLVYVTRGKTIHLRRDPKRLEDVLSSRLDE